MDAVDFEHPAWRTAAGTFGSYLLLLAALTVALFLVPWAIFAFVL